MKSIKPPLPVLSDVWMKNITLIGICCLVFGCSAPAQIATKETVKGKAKEYYDRADMDIAYQKFETADSLLQLAVNEKNNFIDAWLLIGELNSRFLRNYRKAASAYERVTALQADYAPDAWLNLAICYIQLGNYANARGPLQKYLSFPKTSGMAKIKAEKLLADCDFAEEALKNPVDFKPVNLGRNINTPDDESMPSLTADGKYLCFTKHYGKGIYQDEDIYWSLHTAAGFAPAISISSMINTEQYIEGAQNISASGKYLFFTSADRKDGLGSADIYMSRRVGDVWERANNIGPPINTPGYETQPYITADGKALYFAANRSEGEGGTDIYVSYLNADGTWNKPQNLGKNINTPFDEMRPFLHPDGKTLYFSSRGHAGMGNFDLFVSRLQPDGTWSKPVNLGYPINTAGDELGIYITPDGATAYFASEREGGYGQMDIYRFEMPASARPSYTTYIKGIIYDSDTRDPIQAQVQIYDLTTGSPYATVSADKVNGQFLATLPSGKNFGIQVVKDGYLFHSEHISLEKATAGAPFEVNIGLRRIKVGERLVLNNVFFDSDRHNLKPESEAELDNVLKLLQQNTTLQVEIGGHTDNTGSESYNRELSEKRARSVYEYLLRKGIDAKRMTYKGYASSSPVADNNTEEGKAKNRRTELIITAF
ncbi:MAG: OmpA family protein [Chitinophagales bacterium]|nr:OmpA family protein [Chitinophagales bacterium]